jgi:hypothetical protein
VPYGANSTRGVSDTAEFVVWLSAEYDRKWRASADFFVEMSKAHDSLLEVCGEASHPNWDGYTGSAVVAETCEMARRFLSVLPLGTEMPAVAVDADGLVSLEWYHSPRRTLSVSVSPDGEMYYAALVGASSRHGTHMFYDSLPRDLMDLIREVTS